MSLPFKVLMLFWCLNSWSDALVQFLIPLLYQVPTRELFRWTISAFDLLSTIIIKTQCVLTSVDSIYPVVLLVPMFFSHNPWPFCLNPLHNLAFQGNRNACSVATSETASLFRPPGPQLQPLWARNPLHHSALCFWFDGGLPAQIPADGGRIRFEATDPHTVAEPGRDRAAEAGRDRACAAVGGQLRALTSWTDGGLCAWEALMGRGIIPSLSSRILSEGLQCVHIAIPGLYTCISSIQECCRGDCVANSRRRQSRCCSGIKDELAGELCRWVRDTLCSREHRSFTEVVGEAALFLPTAMIPLRNPLVVLRVTAGTAVVDCRWNRSIWDILWNFPWKGLFEVVLVDVIRLSTHNDQVFICRPQSQRFRRSLFPACVASIMDYT